MRALEQHPHLGSEGAKGNEIVRRERIDGELADREGRAVQRERRRAGGEGAGIEEILEAIVERVPAPVENPDKLLRCSVFDSLYDTYRGVVSYVRVFSGTVKKGQRVKQNDLLLELWNADIRAELNLAERDAAARDRLAEDRRLCLVERLRARPKVGADAAGL